MIHVSDKKFLYISNTLHQGSSKKYHKYFKKAQLGNDQDIFSKYI